MKSLLEALSQTSKTQGLIFKAEKMVYLSGNFRYIEDFPTGIAPVFY